MNLPVILFYLFASVASVSAVGVITTRNTVYSVLYLVLTFVASGVIWMLLETEFLALILVLVYVGAVMTLFLFVVMMLDTNDLDKSSVFVRSWPISVLVILSLIAMLIIATHSGKDALAVTASWRPLSIDYSNVADIGKELYTNYVWPFEIAAVLLLAAIVAAITLAYKKSVIQNLRQDPTSQGSINKSDRIRIVNIKNG